DVGLIGPTGELPQLSPSAHPLRRRPLFETGTRTDCVAELFRDSDSVTVDPADRLASWLGLGDELVAGRAVMIRRWVARWLLSGVGRADDPVEEFVDRARVVGLTVVELVDDPAT
ncbi:MAG: hypothetical protein ACKOYM_03245, partial [Actinomycetes bacterium]